MKTAISVSMSEPLSPNIKDRPKIVDINQNVRIIDSSIATPIIERCNETFFYPGLDPAQKRPLSYDIAYKAGNGNIDSFPLPELEKKEKVQTALTELGTFLGAPEEQPIENLDAFIQSFGVSDIFALAGYAQLSLAESPMLRTERTQALSRRILEIKGIDPNIFLDSWRASKSPPFDKLLILLGNTTLRCAPQEAVLLIKNITTPDVLQHLNSGILGPSFLYNASPNRGVGFSIIPSTLEPTQFHGDVQSQLALLLSYGRPETLLKIEPHAEEAQKQFSAVFNQLILHGYPESPYYDPAVEKIRFGQINAPAFNILKKYKGFMYFGDANNLGPYYYRARIGFYSPDDNGRLKDSNLTASRKLSHALGTLLSTGYPVGFKMSTGGIEGTDHSSAVIYIPPFGLPKILSEFEKAGVYDPKRMDSSSSNGLVTFYQQEPIPFSIRASHEVDWEEKELDVMNNHLEAEWGKPFGNQIHAL